MRTVLVTGASGVVGRAVAAHLHPGQHRQGHEDHHAELVRQPGRVLCGPVVVCANRQVKGRHARHHGDPHLAEVEREPRDTAEP